MTAPYIPMDSASFERKFREDMAQEAKERQAQSPYPGAPYRPAQGQRKRPDEELQQLLDVLMTNPDIGSVFPLMNMAENSPSNSVERMYEDRVVKNYSNMRDTDPVSYYAYSSGKRLGEVNRYREGVPRVSGMEERSPGMTEWITGLINRYRNAALR